MPFYHPNPSAASARPLLGIVLANTGSPDQPTPSAVRRYLAQFLADPRVIEFPRWLWLPVLHLIILTFRPFRSARLYRRIWTENGSPLVYYTRRLAEKLQAALNASSSLTIIVEPGMCYGNPSIASALRKLRDLNASHILILPLFPQYSGTTSGAIFQAATAELRTWRSVPAMTYINSYHDHPAYIQAIAANLKNYLADQPASQNHLLLSFHGIPRSYVEKGDPYRQECIRSAELIASELELPAERWSYSFQSRFGPQEWLQPYTDETLTQLAGKNFARLDVACPGFAVDCLETIDEIGNEGKETYHQAGGGEFRYLPALNDSPGHVEVLIKILQPYLPR